MAVIQINNVLHSGWTDISQHTWLALINHTKHSMVDTNNLLYSFVALIILRWRVCWEQLCYHYFRCWNLSNLTFNKYVNDQVSEDLS